MADATAPQDAEMPSLLTPGERDAAARVPLPELEQYQIAAAGTQAVFADPQDPDSDEARWTRAQVVAWGLVFDRVRGGKRLVPLVFDARRGAAIDATVSPLFLGVQHAEEDPQEAAKRLTRRYLELRFGGVLHAARAALFPELAATAAPSPVLRRRVDVRTPTP